MSIALIGQAGLAGVSHTSPETISYTSTGGNTLVIAGHYFNAAATNYPTSVTDSAGNTWQVSTTSAQTPPTAQNNVAGTGFLTDFVAWCVGAKAVTSVTLARQDSGSVFWRVALSEWSGISGFDNSWSGIATTPVSPWTMGPVTINVKGSLVVGVGAPNAGTPGTPTGWTAFTSAGSAFQGYFVQNTTGSYSPQWKTSGNTVEQWAGALAVFQPAQDASVPYEAAPPAIPPQLWDELLAVAAYRLDGLKPPVPPPPVPDASVPYEAAPPMIPPPLWDELLAVAAYRSGTVPPPRPPPFTYPASAVPGLMVPGAADPGDPAYAKVVQDPFTGRAATSGVMAGRKTAPGTFTGPAAASGVANGVNVGAGGMAGPAAVSGTVTGSKVAEGAFTGTAALSAVILGTPPVTGSFTGAAAAAGMILAALPAPLFGTGTPRFGWAAGVPVT